MSRIIGIGVDVVDLSRFAQMMQRTPAVRERLFTPAEAQLPLHSLGARFAAKEAIAKALGAPAGLGWHDAEVVTAASGAPSWRLRGTVAAHARDLGVQHVHLSMSHDGGIAIAYVVAEGA